jgi:hypothetical protein
MAKRPTVTAMESAVVQLRKKTERLGESAMKHFKRLMRDAANAKTEEQSGRYEARAFRDLKLMTDVMARNQKLMEKFKKK